MEKRDGGKPTVRDARKVNRLAASFAFLSAYSIQIRRFAPSLATGQLRMDQRSCTDFLRKPYKHFYS
jgi:hypothetical protein